MTGLGWHCALAHTILCNLYSAAVSNADDGSNSRPRLLKDGPDNVSPPVELSFHRADSCNLEVTSKLFIPLAKWCKSNKRFLRFGDCKISWKTARSKL